MLFALASAQAAMLATLSVTGADLYLTLIHIPWLKPSLCALHLTLNLIGCTGSVFNYPKRRQLS